MNMKAAAKRMIISILCIARKALPIFWALKAITKEKIMTGKPVPSANNKGKSKPPEDPITSGIKAPKNKTALYGQNAKANKDPSRNAPNPPLPASHSLIFSNPPPLDGSLILIRPIIAKPINTKNGPSIFSPQLWTDAEIRKADDP